MSGSPQPSIVVVGLCLWFYPALSLPSAADLVKARLLVTNKTDLTFIHLFEAEITSSLLATIDNPTLSMKYVAWPIIKHRKIPFQPYSNFRERIIGYLLKA